MSRQSVNKALQALAHPHNTERGQRVELALLDLVLDDGIKLQPARQALSSMAFIDVIGR